MVILKGNSTILLLVAGVKLVRIFGLQMLWATHGIMMQVYQTVSWIILVPTRFHKKVKIKMVIVLI